MTTYYAPALDKGLDILEFLSAQRIPMSQLEIANGIERKPNEIYRMLISLENRGYIAKDTISGKYSLTMRLFQLAHHHSPVDSLIKVSEIHLTNLANNINQSVHLSVLHQGQLMIIAQVKSQTPVSLSVEVGSLFPLEKTISGKVLLSNLNVAKRKQIFEFSDIYKTFSTNEKKAFKEELKTLKGQQCVYQRSQLTEGVTDFAAPILDMRNEIVAVVAVSTLTSQMRKLVSTEDIEKELVLVVCEIRRALGIITDDK